MTRRSGGELLEPAAARVAVVAPAHDLRAVPDAAVAHVVERDPDDELGPQRHPFELAPLRPAARVGRAPLARLVRPKPLHERALLAGAEARRVPNDVQLARV